MKKKKILFLFLFFSLALLNYAIAADPGQIIVNSADWRDVYSAMLYSSLTGRSTNFLVSDRHASLILPTIPTTTHLWVFSSKKVPFIIDYESFAEGKGYTAEEFTYDNFNLALADNIDTTSFIVIDDSYGYNAISVAPYAVVTNSFVLFADKDNIGDVDDFLTGKGATDIIIYGNVDREVKSTLAKYNPEIINKEGDRFANNLEIVKKYQEIKNVKQVVLTNGEFIEKEIMSGSEPVIFIGTNNVPDIVRDYIKGSDIEVGVLIGNELVGTATFIRRQIGISVFVKFAQGARAPKGAISQVEALDMFYLPIYTLNLIISSIKYNKATNQLEITFENTEEQAVYFKGTYTIKAGGTTQVVGDKDPVFIDGNEIKTIVYDIEPLPEGEINADIYVVYGESKNSLEKVIDTSLKIETVTIFDECKIAVDEMLFNKKKQMFYISTENIGDVKCYVDAEVVDVLIAGEKNTFGMENIEDINPKEEKKLRIKAALEEEDIEDNKNIKVRIYYGQRQDGLVKVWEDYLELTIKGVDYIFYVLMVVILLLIFLIVKRRRDKDKEK